MNSVEFAGKRWIALKKENGKTLLVFGAGYFGNEYFYSRTSDFLSTCSNCGVFFERIREYLNIRFSDYIFSENEKKHITVVENKYPVMSAGKDDLGFRINTFKMEIKKDRVFPLRYIDVCGLSSGDLRDVISLEKRQRVILLPQNIDKNQKISTISHYEHWKTGRGYHEVDGFSFDTLREDIRGDEHYTYEIIPAIWVNSNAI